MTIHRRSRQIRHLDLFSGIGGFALAGRRIWGGRHRVAAFCEIDTFCQTILRKHWPKATIVDDIFSLKGSHYVPIDILTGGFPCQPFSTLGRRGGKSDDRYLWPEMLRVIKESKPRWIVCENVAGFVSMALDDVLSDLEAAKYKTETFILPACSIGASHRRDRCWIIAYPRSIRIHALEFDKTTDIKALIEAKSKGQSLLNNAYRLRNNKLRRRPGYYFPRKAHGFSGRLDKSRRKALGNAIVPQVAQVIFAAIKWADDQLCRIK